MKRTFPLNSWTDSDVEAHWDSVAHLYVNENERVKGAHDQRFGFSIRHLGLEAGMKILNISSRDGEATDYILKVNPGCEVVNAEISGNLMEVAEKMRPGLRQQKLDTYSELPFGDHAFDRILTLETLEHAAEPQAFLSELHRVSTPGATMVLSCPPATSEIPYRIYTLLFGGHGEGPHRFPPSGRVKRMLSLTGWRLVHHQGTLLFPVGPAWFQRWGEWILQQGQHTFISELGIRQFYVCNKQ